MNTRTFTCAIGFLFLFWNANAVAVDCDGLPEWKRQHYYVLGDMVQYRDVAYQNLAESSKRDKPDPDYVFPWQSLGTCDAPGGGGSGGDPVPISIYGVWHCGNSFCDWSQLRDTDEFDAANRWIIDRGDGTPSVSR